MIIDIHVMIKILLFCHRLVREKSGDCLSGKLDQMILRNTHTHTHKTKPGTPTLLMHHLNFIRIAKTNGQNYLQELTHVLVAFCRLIGLRKKYWFN